MVLIVEINRFLMHTSASHAMFNYTASIRIKFHYFNYNRINAGKKMVFRIPLFYSLFSKWKKLNFIVIHLLSPDNKVPMYPVSKKHTNLIEWEMNTKKIPFKLHLLLPSQQIFFCYYIAVNQSHVDIIKVAHYAAQLY